MTTGPFDRLEEMLPSSVREVVDRDTPIPRIAGEAARRSRADGRLVRADIGQISDLDPAREILYGPPVGLEELRASLASLWTRTYSLEGMPGLESGLEARHVAITTGAAEGLSLLFRCFGSARTVGLPRGRWENYENGVSLAGGKSVVIDVFDADGSLAPERLERQIRELEVSTLVVNFPQNPTGAVLGDREAARLRDVARAADVVVIADEVYNRLRFDGQPPLTLLRYAPERTAVVSSASKEYLIPGARVGFVLSAHADLTDRVLRKLIRANTASPNVLGQKLLLERVNEELQDLREGRPPRHLARIRDELARRQAELIRILRAHEFTLSGRPGHEPQGTIFLMAGLPPWWRGSDEEFAEAALSRGLLSVVPGASFGIEDSVRFSFGGLTAEALARLDANLRQLREETTG